MGDTSHWIAKTYPARREILKILITGGAGFIASYLIEGLIRGNKIIAYDNLTRNSLKFTDLQQHPNMELVEGDVLNYPILSNAMQGVDICIHTAAIAGLYSTSKNYLNTMKVNLLGTYYALEACVKNNVKRFIDFSTSEVYGPFVYKGKESDYTTLGPINEKRWVYAISKLAAEHLAHTYQEECGLEVITIRPFNIYGPRQTIGGGAISGMVEKALKDEDVIVYNDGTQIRAWCYVTDFADALYEIVGIANFKNQVFNIGNPQATITVLNLAEKILKMTDSKSRIVFRKHPGAEVDLRIPDISLASNILNYKPKVSLEQGLRKTIDWIKFQMKEK